MESNIIRIIAQNIKMHRAKLCLSQEQLAFKSGLHRTYISLLEREKKNITIKMLYRIAQALNVELIDLLK